MSSASELNPMIRLNGKCPTSCQTYFLKQKVKPIHPPLFFNGLRVKSVGYHKDLGLTPDLTKK